VKAGANQATYSATEASETSEITEYVEGSLEEVHVVVCGVRVLLETRTTHHAGLHHDYGMEGRCCTGGSIAITLALALASPILPHPYFPGRYPPSIRDICIGP
jgi:hypothetical protein